MSEGARPIIRTAFGDLRTMIRFGDQGPDVRRVQSAVWLDEHHELSGSFTLRTLILVRLYQAGLGLTVDGVVGPRTRALMAHGARVRHLPPLRRGDQGPDVLTLHMALGQWADDCFTSVTSSAVYDVQVMSSEKPTGIVTEQTWLSLLWALL